MCNGLVSQPLKSVHQLYLHRHWNWIQKGEGKTDAVDQQWKKQLKKTKNAQSNRIPLESNNAIEGFNTENLWHNRNHSNALRK